MSIAGGRIVFGVSGNGTGDRTICRTTSVVDNQWHHVAVQRRRSDGFLSLYVDGVLQAFADGPDGDVSYPDNGVPGNFCGGACTNSDPFLVLGAEKHDAGPAFPSYTGLIDELRISGVLRYAANFTRPRAPFVTDAVTVALYRFDEGSGATANDTSGVAGGPANGAIRRATPSGSPTWSTDTPFNVGALSLDTTIRRTVIATGFVNPVDIVAAPGDATRLFIVEQAGRIRIIRDGIVVATPFLDVTSKTTGGGEQDLLGLAFHPDYASNRRFFVYYTRTGDGALIIERYERSPDHPERTDFASGRVLLAIPHPSAANHNGGKLAFRADGYLYVGTGDGGGGNDPFNNGQSFGTRLGKMLRVDVNVETAPYFAIPPSNPFATMTCVIGSPCTLTLVATGTPSPALTRTGPLPGGVGYNPTTRTISGTANAGTTGTYVQTINATNGIVPSATQALTIVVAASCGGFTDVTGTDSYCNGVEWLRNRAITTGCTASRFCPLDVVTRASMALFQYRLGGAFSPLLGVTERTQTAAIDNEPVVCAGTSDLAPVAYPRNVQAFFSASVETTGPLTVGVALVASRNAGATWEPVSLTRMRAQTTGAASRSASGHGVLAVNAGDAVRFGLSLNREGGAASVSSVRCQVAWMGVNRDGAAPPRDVSAPQP